MTETFAAARSRLWLSPGSPRRERWGRSRAGPVLVGLPAVLAVGLASLYPNLVRVAVALPAIAIFVAFCVKSYRHALVAVLVWLTVFGTMRRVLLAPGTSTGDDPLLLVAPAVLGLLVVVAARQGAFRAPTTLARNVLVLSGLVVLAALNPLQGGIAVGAGGLLFVLVPLLWFWVGRGLVDAALLERILRIVSVLAVAAAVYGLLQVYVGFPWWDTRWIETKGYAALYVGRAVRPFASFSSSSEYVGFLAIGIVVWAIRLRRASRPGPVVLAILVIGWALVVASVRGALVVVPIALGMTFATSRGFGIGRTALAGVGALFVLGLVVSQFQGSSNSLVSRQLTGLSDPFDRDKSTLPAHVDALVEGIGTGLRHPVGQGLGLITIAGEKFGSTSVSTDVDPSNVAIAMGIPGLLSYGAVVFLAFRAAFWRARRLRDPLSLAVVGVCLVTMFQWLNGGNYAVAPLPWLLLGWLDGSAGRAGRDRAGSSAPSLSTSAA